MKNSFIPHAQNGSSFIIKKSHFFSLMIIVAVLINIKYIFVDFGIDAEYQISMSYRLVTGDAMFKEMWEPSQMSTFLCAILIKMWMCIFHSTTGIVLFLQLMGCLIDGSIAYAIYRVVVKYFHCPKTAFMMAWVYFLVSPKDVPLPEYANMQVWSATLLCITFFLYYKESRKKYLVLMAICLCAMILSYPSCIIVFAGITGLLIYLRKKKDIIVFGGICLTLGIIYLGFIFSNISVTDFLIVIKNLFAIETAHEMEVIDKFLFYFKDIAKMACVLGLIYVMSFGLVWVANCRKKEDNKEHNRILTNIIFFLIIMVISLYTTIFFKSDWRFYYSIIFIGIIIIGFQYTRKLSKDEFIFYLCCNLVSIMEFFATLLLTNLEMIASVPYLLVTVISAFLPISSALRESNISSLTNGFKRIVVIIFILLLAFRNVYIIRPMWKHMNTILEIEGIVKSGPAIGIMSTYMGPYIQNETMKEWEQYIEEGDTIYLIGGSLDTLAYLYADTSVAAPSVVPTPGYNENILNYWILNPHKYPDVIVASCWYGTMDVELQEDSWIMEWIEKEYKPDLVIDGKYWRYYIKRK